MHDDLAGHAATGTVLSNAEAGRRKAVLGRLKAELAALGVESVLAGRHLLVLKEAGPWSASGPADPELHVLGVGCRCTVVTDGVRYLVAGSALRAADAPGAAACIAANAASVAAHAIGQDPGQPGRDMGAGERALRQLIDDGLI